MFYTKKGVKFTKEQVKSFNKIYGWKLTEQECKEYFERLDDIQEKNELKLLKNCSSNEKKCLCIKTHYRTFYGYKMKFQKNEEYKILQIRNDHLTHAIIEHPDLESIKPDIKYSFYQFEEFFTNDIKQIREIKLKVMNYKIKKGLIDREL